MDRLPTELVELLAVHCDFSSLKNLRLTNPEFQHAATPLVFEHFYMGYFPHHVAKLHLLPDRNATHWLHPRMHLLSSPLLESWSKQEFARLRQTCKDCAERLDGCGKCNSMLLHYQASQDAQLPSPKPTEEQIEAAMSRYHELSASQRAWREDVEGRVFQEAFNLLPNLVGADLATAASFEDYGEVRPVWKSVEQETHFRLGEAGGYFEGNEHMDRGPRHPGPGQAALCLLEAIGFRAQFAGTKHLTRLDVRGTHCRPYRALLGVTLRQGRMASLGPSPAHDHRYNNLIEGFRHLTDLSLDVTYTPSVQGSAREMASEATLFLLAARQLRRLDLKYVDVNTGAFDISPADALRDFFDAQSSGPCWPHLTHLALSANLDSTRFLRFLKQHAATLTALELRDMNIAGSCDLLYGIPKVVKLDHIQVMHLEGCTIEEHHLAPTRLGELPCEYYHGIGTRMPYDGKMEAYLLRQAESPPQMEDW
ncbi:hypothetical protein LTR53_003561 [Teratosphaeriaceae sp. CCFEE 6253]|nr:hypothetical protein LTR53_003561 [Teratosphaeriaceae sp. CCFEE 6253]